MTHSPNDSFTNALFHSMTPFTQRLIEPLASFTNALIQWPIHPMTHSANALIHQCPHSFSYPFTQWLIHQCPHSYHGPFTQWLIHQCPHSFKDPLTQWLIHQWPHSPNDSFSQCPHSPCVVQQKKKEEVTVACSMPAPQLTCVRKWLLQICGAELCVCLGLASKLYIWRHAFRCNETNVWLCLAQFRYKNIFVLIHSFSMQLRLWHQSHRTQTVRPNIILASNITYYLF